jgi:hypothetical protein
MPNLIRLKQIDNPELSGYVRQIGDAQYYLNTNPSGYLSSVTQDPDFNQLDVDFSTLSGNLNSSLNSTGSALSSSIASTGTTLNTKIDNLSGYVNLTNTNLSTVSGNVNYVQFLATGLDYSSNVLMSGNIINTSGYAANISGVLNSKISTVSGNLGARVSALENTFAYSGSNFVDLNSNGQTVVGQKTFNSKTSFKQINIIPVSGNYSNPGGLSNLMFTQFIDNNVFYVSGLGYITGDFFVTKFMYPNNIECIVSTMIYTGSY